MTDQIPAPPSPVVVAQLPPTSGAAVVSLVFGILGALGGWCLAGVPCIVAVVTGHRGLRETRDGQRGGRGMAIAGLVLGYLFVAPTAIGFASLVTGAGISLFQ